MCVEEKKKKKKKAHGWNEMREKRNNINIKNPNWEILPQYFYNKF